MRTDARLPAHLEVAAIRRIAESQGGFAAVLGKGDPDSGVIAVVIICRDEPAMLMERMPNARGNRRFIPTLVQDIDSPAEFSAILSRRRDRDPDSWLIEVDVPDKERFVAALPG
ncbi:DUF1491 family protein [Altererythrobacter aerius]|uniref:DUF1491 family protein n=1 Tax=Tsuneonella aeria TaxID=1837929 RepID=A0A6I4TG17_9SPHN|nr:DUF1491 family protein [Tsuneonella aeria]MXO75418.1 DUF1491 family protein [Tsuneonella aeria]